ncbi:cytochrome P450 [Phanerochaete sordida]|uniref:Cytochrome P450 n=1 Tax=Phanerochaete sordida TaxID=48140 RepID=A0A9P3GIH2_9APHY|nr:cytochrome P450 [Phanerochaete sordida]
MDPGTQTLSSNPWMTACICEALLTIWLIYAYRDRAFGSSSNTGIPGPKGVPVLGNLRQLLPYKEDFMGWLSTNEAIYGPLFTYTVPGFGRSVVIDRPEWLEHVKKKDMIAYGKGKRTLAIFREFFGSFSQASTEGDAWKANRRITTSLVSIKTFDKQVARAMGEVIPTAIELLTSIASSESVMDWNIFAGRLSLEMLFRVAFSADAKSLSADPSCLETKNEILDALHTCGKITMSRFANPGSPLVEKINGTHERFRSARAKLWTVADRIADERLHLREEGLSNEDDYLTVLLASQLGRQLTRETLVAILFAGQDNNVNLLGWSLYELTRSPSWIQRMRDEAESKGVDGRIIDWNSVSSYPVHLAVLYETLRLWPGVPKNSRCAMEDDILPGIPSLGYGPVKISKGDYVVWSDHLMMRRTDVWGEDAQVFNPGRHLDAEGKFVKPQQPKFHAFGAGPRACSGSQLATYEFVQVWAALLPLFDIEPVEMKEREMADGLTSTMAGDFLVRVKLRK